MFRRFRDPGSGLSHLLGAIASLVALGFMLNVAIRRRSARDIIAFSVFGASLVMLYSASAAYHIAIAPKRVIAKLRALDHSMIYVLIAGTYTPVCLLLLRGSFGNRLLIAAWTMAAIGVTTRLLYKRIPRLVYTLGYIAMGLVVLFAVRPLCRVIPPKAVLWLVGGGVAYLIGAIIYLLKRPNLVPKWLDFHVIWHIFVLLGSTSHFVFVYKFC